MAYPDKIKNKAYELYLSGFTYEQITNELKKKYKKNCKTLNRIAVFRWAKRYDWDKQNVKEMATLTIEKKVVNNLVDMNDRDSLIFTELTDIVYKKIQQLKNVDRLTFNDLKELKISTEVLEKSIYGRRKVLGLDYKDNDDESKAMEKLKEIFGEVEN